jgi:acyl carrier protein
MIVIDGKQYDVGSQNFENLDQIFIKVVEDGHLEDRIVTDVMVNDEPFTEIYPHQAEDIEMDSVESVEIVTMSADEMAVEITLELYKVVNIMSEGAKQVAELFRQADDSEALETYQDLLEVIRNFLSMIGALRDEYSLQDNADYEKSATQLNELFTEMSSVLENEDWILLADLLEYEFLPAVEQWKRVIKSLRDDIRKTRG